MIFKIKCEEKDVVEGEDKIHLHPYLQVKKRYLVLFYFTLLVCYNCSSMTLLFSFHFNVDACYIEKKTFLFAFVYDDIIQ